MPQDRKTFEELFRQMYDEERVRKSMGKLGAKKNLSPYKELQHGDESIHDHIIPDQKVPIEVLKYLRHGQFQLACMGVYEHPFEEGVRLPGPYTYGDDKYRWDRDMWLYVSKYHVELPQDFIDHVFSDEGRAWMEEHPDEMFGQGHESINKNFGRVINLTPENDGALPG